MRFDNITLQSRLTGYVFDEQGRKYAFLYENMKLFVFPNEEQSFEIENDHVQIASRAYRRGEVLQDKVIEGNVAGRNVVVRFVVSPLSTKVEEFVSYDVFSFYCYKPCYGKINKQLDSKNKNVEYFDNKIDGILLYGQEIDLFLNPGYAFGRKIETDENKISQYYIYFDRSKKTYPCGEFQFNDHSVKIELVNRVTEYTLSATPFIGKSVMKVNFDGPVELKEAICVFKGIKHVLAFLFRRTNIQLTGFSVRCKSEIEREFGVYEEAYETKEEMMDIKDRYIDYLYIQDSFAPLVKMAIDRDLFYDNIPNDVSA